MFFSARRVVRPILGQVQRAVQQHLKAGSRVAQMNADHAVVHLAAIAVPLAPHAHGLPAALGRARFVDAANRLRMSVLLGHDRLTAVTQLLFIPLDRFEEPLQRPRRPAGLQGDRLGRFAMQIRELALDIDSQQLPGITPSETIAEQRQKQSELSSQCRNLL